MNRALVAIFSVAVGLAGCALNPDSVPLGQDRQQTLAKLGAPTAVYPLPLGERLQYSRQPYGRQVYNLDLDTAGKLASARQVLTEAEFVKVQVDQWLAADVERAFGKPAMVTQIRSFDGPVWSYRYDYYGTPKQFHVFLDAKGVVRRTQRTEEPVGNDRRHEP